MRRVQTTLSAGLAALATCGLFATFGGRPAEAADKPQVVLETSLGNITIELEPEKAPKTVENFLKYVDAGFYNGTIFHRVIPGFMIQGGGYSEQMQEKPTNPPVKNESGNGLSNAKGTIAMARTSNPDSATAQFFINVRDNVQLDRLGGGYAVFGRVVDGQETIDKILKVERKRNEMGEEAVPVQPIVIRSAKRKG